MHEEKGASSSGSTIGQVRVPFTPVDLEALQVKLGSGLGSLLEASHIENGALIAHVRPENIRAALEALRDTDGLQLTVMTHMTAVDLLPMGPGPMASQAIDAGSDLYAKLQRERIAAGEPRFAVVYELFSHIYRHRVRVKAFLQDTGSDEVLPAIDTVSDIYLTANWHERECYDLFGIDFTGHPDLRRILLPDRWDGYPLRKEYPFDGKRAWRLGTTLEDAVQADSHLGL
ncbi:NADH-quinone oxidoreductase subunit C [bacterium]|nr:NADH-quinone oxidoreductase subunit C [bacterium]